MFVTFEEGSAVVERSKVKLASSESAAKAVRRALVGRYVVEEPAQVIDGRIVEGAIRRLRPGTDEFDRAALLTLPRAFVYED